MRRPSRVRVFDESEWNWRDLVAAHSLGWVVASDGNHLVGFVNVLWDGLVHALDPGHDGGPVRGRGVGTPTLLVLCGEGAREAGCEWFHVDFDDHLRGFYLDACGFTPTDAGLIAVQE